MNHSKTFVECLGAISVKTHFSKNGSFRVVTNRKFARARHGIVCPMLIMGLDACKSISVASLATIDIGFGFHTFLRVFNSKLFEMFVTNEK
jgi:hypothetical protein